MKMLLLVPLMSGILASCGGFDKAMPISQERAAFVGLWRAPSSFELEIKPGGTADIRQISDASAPDYEKLNIKVAPLTVKDLLVQFKEGNVLLLIKPTLYAREYHIDSSPYQDGGEMKMVLNGVTFVRGK
jgi:hypothetical protein